ncbi:hypothetical protein J7E86_23445, partial [Streptomyces sp. ISL-11]|nr:hypothetical protein [Streptomyces sp. ISL-11]
MGETTAAGAARRAEDGRADARTAAPNAWRALSGGAGRVESARGVYGVGAAERAGARRALWVSRTPFGAAGSPAARRGVSDGRATGRAYAAGRADART